jgi:large subunit GTPase 1
MPKQQRSQGKGKPRLNERGFGKSLIRQQRENDPYTRGVKERTNMVSILDNSALSDYVDTMQMEDQMVDVQRGREFEICVVEKVEKVRQQELTSIGFQYEHLSIPRKPAWDRNMTAEEVDRREKDAFLAWRRDIASVEANAGGKRVTPFEKNIEVRFPLSLTTPSSFLERVAIYVHTHSFN